MSADNTKLESRVKTVEEAMQMLTQLALRADERMDEFDARLNALAEAQARTEANLSALASIVGDTERHLNQLAATVERYISEGRNGSS